METLGVVSKFLCEEIARIETTANVVNTNCVVMDAFPSSILADCDVTKALGSSAFCPKDTGHVVIV